MNPSAGALDPRPLRILQLVQRPQLRGAEVFAQRLVAVLRRDGHVAKTLFLYRQESSRGPESGVDERVLGGAPDHPLEKFPGWRPGLVRALLREISRFRPHVVQVNGARTVKYGALARRLSPWAPWRLVYRNIGDPWVWQGPPLRRLAFRLLVVPGIDGVAALSQRNLEAFRELYGFKGPARVIPNAVVEVSRSGAAPNQLRDSCGLSAGAPVLLFVGALSPEKRPDRLVPVLEAVRRRRPDARLWVVGDGPEGRRLDAQIAARPGLSDAVVRWGVRNDLQTFYEEADLLLLASDTEGMPGVVLEAALAGLPAVAPRVGDLESCIQDGETGFLTAPGDTEALASAVTRLVEDPALRSYLGCQARSEALARFTMDAVAPQLVALYHEVLAAGRKTRA